MALGRAVRTRGGWCQGPPFGRRAGPPVGCPGSRPPPCPCAHGHARYTSALRVSARAVHSHGLRLAGWRRPSPATRARVDAGSACRRDRERPEARVPRLRHAEAAAPSAQAQKRSGFSVAVAVTVSPAAVTRSAERRLSQLIACLRRTQPKPPPSVRPAMPVVETSPPVVASPNSCVSRSKSPQVTPGRARAFERRGRCGRPSAPRGRSRGRRRRRHCRPRYAASANGHEQVVLAREVDGRHDVRHAGEAGDQRGTLVDHPVPDPAGRLKLTPEVGGESREGGFV